jgi:hypothetical protein
MHISAAIELVLSLLSQMQRVSGMIAKAIAEKRDISTDEWAEIKAADDAARADLAAAIKKAEDEGR